MAGGDAAIEGSETTALTSSETMTLLDELHGKSTTENLRVGATDHKNSDRIAKETSQILSLELLVVVAQFLAGSDLYATLAALNTACKLVRTETLPILCETVILAPDSTPIFAGLTGRVKDFMRKHGKHIRYLIADEDLQIPSEVSNLCVQLSRSERLARTYQGDVIVVPSLSVRIGNTVSASTFEHLIRLSTPDTNSDDVGPKPFTYPAPDVCHVFGSGRIVEARGRAAVSILLRSFYYETALNFDTEERNPEDLQDTMGYLLQACPVANSYYEGGGHPAVNIYLSNVVALQALIGSLDKCLRRCPQTIPTLQLHTKQITIDDIKAFMPALAAMYAANWSLITPSPRSYLLWIELDIDEDDGYKSDDNESNNSAIFYHQLELLFAAEDAADLDGGGEGVTFRLFNYASSNSVWPDKFGKDNAKYVLLVVALGRKWPCSAQDVGFWGGVIGLSEVDALRARHTAQENAKHALSQSGEFGDVGYEKRSFEDAGY
ncbi:hypothetical protein QFC21_006059 [Naganishia friedmannii]|uniref:Uncharacterized protein n=1 Tax=Naganishia friedmannii TaxID=89922 RepID=A0ACC2V533_9TREE|nr:hypothetical protein QFC21_006059 [Naganishia friedmannii]